MLPLLGSLVEIGGTWLKGKQEETKAKAEAKLVEISAEADIKATYEVLKAQIEKYQNQDWEDKKGVVTKPVQNNIEALHKFTNLNNPVDFASRMVYNEEGVEVINFGKHKGRAVEDVFQSEPSYYNWMQNGDFPLYTKKCFHRLIPYSFTRYLQAIIHPLWL